VVLSENIIEFCFQLRDFLRELLLAMQRAEKLLEEQKKKQGSTGFWASLFCLDDERNEEYTVDDRRRVVDLLKKSYTQLCTTYEVILFLTMHIIKPNTFF
jgi:hypothetical protein